MIRLTSETISKEDIDALCDWLKSYPRLTKGQLVEEFEDKFANMVGTSYAIFVNSGSSANLLACSALQEIGVQRVVVPALCWSTDISPVIQLGMEPIIVDCNTHNLAVDLDHLKEIFEKHRPGALILVSVLGIQPEMAEIRNLCRKHEVILIEDACESFGSTYNNMWLGTMGAMGTYSFYFSHHLSTIEGGMIVTNNADYYALLLMKRAHGWDRDLNEKARRYLHKTYNISAFNAPFTFYTTGFNVRPTEIQAFIGLKQLERATEMIKKRESIANQYKVRLSKKGIWTPTFCNPPDTFSNFGWPLISRNRDRLVDSLTSNNVECRPLIAGAINEHPIMTNGRFIKTETPNAKLIHKQGMYIPNHIDITMYDVEMMCDIIEKAI